MATTTTPIVVKTEAVRACLGCLSCDRQLQTLGNSRQFVSLLGHQLEAYDLVLCWECTALLRRVQKFQDQIRNAYWILKRSLYQLDQTNIPSLSSLSFTNLVSNEIVTRHDEGVNLESTINDEHKHVISNTVKEETESDASRNGHDIEDCLDREETLLEHDDKKEKKEKYIKRINKPSNNTIRNEDLSIKHYQKLLMTEKELETVGKRVRKGKNIVGRLKTNGRKAIISENKDLDLSNPDKYYTKVTLNENEWEEFVKQDMTEDRALFKDKLSKQYCRMCNVGFIFRVDHRRHVNLKHTKPEGPFTCLECGAKAQSHQTLTEHWQAHNTALRCVVCGALKRLPSHMRDHIASHRRVYKCAACNEQFTSSSEFSDHYNSQHRCYCCDYCGKKCATKQGIKFHIVRKHSPCLCPDCGRLCPSLAARRTHMRLQHAPTCGDAAYCVECDKHFASEARYRIHLNTAVVHKPRVRQSVPCPECGKVFSRRLYMNNHYNRYHGTPRHYCDLCNKYFTTAWSVRCHKAHVHEKQAGPRNKICDLCGRGFTTNRILIHHRRTHTGERPYQCEWCSAAFTQSTALKSHRRTQHKPAPAPPTIHA